MSSEVREALLRGPFRKTTHPFKRLVVPEVISRLPGVDPGSRVHAQVATRVICATCGGTEGGEGHDI